MKNRSLRQFSDDDDNDDDDEDGDDEDDYGDDDYDDGSEKTILLF